MSKCFHLQCRSRAACQPVNKRGCSSVAASPHQSKCSSLLQPSCLFLGTIPGVPSNIQRGRCRRKVLQQTWAALKADPAVPAGSVTLVLLAGGVGKRMGVAMPKQYIPLQGLPIALHSLQTFAAMPEIGQIVIVCDPSYRGLFQEHYHTLPQQPKLGFALPGKERQDSVYNGLQEVSAKAQLVAVHDSARPLIEAKDAAACMADALEVGAAVLGVPVKPTIKEVNSEGAVVKTLQRSCLWEVQTPQVIKPALLQQGFELVRQNNLEVTDDVSIIEAMGSPVRVTKGSYENIKVTTPEDLTVAEGFLRGKKEALAVVS